MWLEGGGLFILFYSLLVSCFLISFHDINHLAYPTAGVLEIQVVRCTILQHILLSACFPDLPASALGTQLQPLQAAFWGDAGGNFAFP